MTDWALPELADEDVSCRLWLMGKEDEQVDGKLNWDSDGLRLWVRMGAGFPETTPVVLHGRTSGGSLFTVPKAVGVDRLTRFEILAQHGVVAGPHLDSVDHEFGALRLRLSGLRGLAGWPAKTSLETGGSLGLYKTDGGTWIQLTELEPRSQQLLDRTYVVPLLSLTKLALSSRSWQPEVLELQVRDAASPDWRSVIRGRRPPGDRLPLEPVLSVADLTADVVARWLNQVESLDSIPAVIARLIGPRDSLDLEPTVLQLTTAAEGLSRRLGLADRMTVAEARAIAAGAVEGAMAVDPERGEMVRGYLEYLHEPSFGGRLTDLSDRAEDLVPRIIGKRGKWKRLVYDSRNDFAHRSRHGWLTEESINRYATVALSFPWVLRVILLAQAGIPAQLLRDRLRNNFAYSAYLENRAEFAPELEAQNDGGAG